MDDAAKQQEYWDPDFVSDPNLNSQVMPSPQHEGFSYVDDLYEDTDDPMNEAKLYEQFEISPYPTSYIDQASPNPPENIFSEGESPEKLNKTPKKVPKPTKKPPPTSNKHKLLKGKETPSKEPMEPNTSVQQMIQNINTNSQKETLDPAAGLSKEPMETNTSVQQMIETMNTISPNTTGTTRSTKRKVDDTDALQNDVGKAPRLIKIPMAGNLYAQTKAQTYFRYRNQIRQQIRRRDYVHLRLGKPTMMADSRAGVGKKLIDGFQSRLAGMDEAKKLKLEATVYDAILMISDEPNPGVNPPA